MGVRRRNSGRARAAGVLSVLVIAVCLAPGVKGAPAGVVDGLNQVWADTLREAAEGVLQVIKTRTKLDLALSDVPLDTLQIFVGRQHHIGLEVEGVQYDIMQDLPQEAEAQDALPEAAKLSRQLPASGLVPRDWRRMQEHSLALPEVTLQGPLELWLSTPAEVSLFTPLAADAGVVSRVVLLEGVTVRVHGMKGISLRRPVTLPRLPAQYLAEVLAHAMLRTPEDGFENAPGILYMASELRREALNSTSGVALLSLEVEPAGPAGLTIVTTQAGHADLRQGPPPRLKARRLKGAALELSVRPGQVAAAGGQHDETLGQQVARLQALSRPSAWPLPSMDMALWVPYETILRNVLASHPFDVDHVQRRGVGVKLTKSAIKGVSLMAFDMEVRGKLAEDAGRAAPGSGYEEGEGTVEVWEVVVRVDSQDPPAEAAVQGGTGLAFTPLRVQRKAVHENTVTLSRAALHGLQYGERANFTTVHGFDEADSGMARSQ